jgi:hypothetical protein
VLVLGAFVLFLGFLLLNQDASDLFQSLAEGTRHRYLGGEPLSDVLMLVAVLAAVTSLLLMLFWPRLEPPKQQFVVRHYFGNSDAAREAAAAANHSFRIPLARYYLTAMARLRRVRNYLGFAG